MLQVCCEERRRSRFHGNDIRCRKEGLVDSSCPEAFSSESSVRLSVPRVWS
jgi:hypothetical protein